MRIDGPSGPTDRILDRLMLVSKGSEPLANHRRGGLLMAKNYYVILGVGGAATQDEIRHA